MSGSDRAATIVEALLSHVRLSRATGRRSRSGRLLEIDAETIAGAASKPDATAPTLARGFHLLPGDTVVITGDTRRHRAAWLNILTERRLMPSDSMVKKAKVLVAADPISMSGKARQARAWGIPILTEEGLRGCWG